MGSVPCENLNSPQGVAEKSQIFFRDTHISKDMRHRLLTTLSYFHYDEVSFNNHNISIKQNGFPLSAPMYASSLLFLNRMIQVEGKNVYNMHNI
jgi:hypothetical protein